VSPPTTATAAQQPEPSPGTEPSSPSRSVRQRKKQANGTNVMDFYSFDGDDDDDDQRDEDDMVPYQQHHVLGSGSNYRDNNHNMLMGMGMGMGMRVSPSSSSAAAATSAVAASSSAAAAQAAAVSAASAIAAAATTLVSTAAYVPPYMSQMPVRSTYLSINNYKINNHEYFQYGCNTAHDAFSAASFFHVPTTAAIPLPATAAPTVHVWPAASAAAAATALRSLWVQQWARSLSVCWCWWCSRRCVILRGRHVLLCWNVAIRTAKADCKRTHVCRPL